MTALHNQIPDAAALRGTRLEYEAKRLGITPDEFVQRLALVVHESEAEALARELMKPAIKEESSK